VKHRSSREWGAAEAHRLARDKGVSRPLYAVVRGVVVPVFRVYFHMHVAGSDNVPTAGAVIIAPNHKSFFDAFFVAACTSRRIRFMGKAELFEGRHGRLLVRLGAFPVRRGETDEEALETARVLLAKGEALALFPEGTRVRDPGSLGTPRRGAARLALETGAPLVPTAITGTEHLFLGPLPLPRRVQVAFAAPIPVEALDEPTPEAASELLEDQLWPQVEGEFRRLYARPGLIVAGLAAVGIAGAVLARRRRR
jgi:1-acyl-sn-glycerol-3-phosphate acyltransferase